jgi:phosphoserine phosphatase
MGLAVFRVEGTLVAARALGCAAWLASAHRDVLARPARVGLVGVASRIGAVVGAEGALGLAFRALTGCSEDRLVVLAGLYAEEVLDRAWNHAGVSLVHRSRDAGDRIVLVSEHPDVVLDGVVARLRPDHVVANRLELDGHGVTGRLVPPVVTGRLDAGGLRALATRLGADPSRTRAYGSTAGDATMLAAAPFPCAVTPDRTLRDVARTLDWPVVER